MKKLSLIIALLVFYALAGVAAVYSSQHVSARITAFDPPPGADLAFYDKVYFQIHYKSDIPVRFQAIPLRKGTVLEYGVIGKTPLLQKPGEGVTYTWVSFTNPTGIDEVRVNVLDAEWNQIELLGINIEMHWSRPQRDDEQPVANWVRELKHKEKRQREFIFDAFPRKEETFYDAFFYVSVFSLPVYFLLQVQFLRHWRKRWRELAFIPILSVTPMIVMSIFGLGMEFRLWVIFMFRGMPLALFYLCALWFAKRMTEGRAQS